MSATATPAPSATAAAAGTCSRRAAGAGAGPGGTTVRACRTRTIRTTFRRGDRRGDAAHRLSHGRDGTALREARAARHRPGDPGDRRRDGHEGSLAARGGRSAQLADLAGVRRRARLDARGRTESPRLDAVEPADGHDRAGERTVPAGEPAGGARLPARAPRSARARHPACPALPVADRTAVRGRDHRTRRPGRRRRLSSRGGRDERAAIPLGQHLSWASASSRCSPARSHSAC